MLLSARSGKVMNHVDDLMTGLTGQRGEGDGDTLEWTDGRLTGVAQKVAKKYAALAVTSTDECPGTEPAPVPVPTAATTADHRRGTGRRDLRRRDRRHPAPSTRSRPDPVAAAAVVAAAASNSPPPTGVRSRSRCVDPISKSSAQSPTTAADQTWVDVMGVGRQPHRHRLQARHLRSQLFSTPTAR